MARRATACNTEDTCTSDSVGADLYLAQIEPASSGSTSCFRLLWPTSLHKVEPLANKAAFDRCITKRIEARRAWTGNAPYCHGVRCFAPQQGSSALDDPAGRKDGNAPHCPLFRRDRTRSSMTNFFARPRPPLLVFYVTTITMVFSTITWLFWNSSCVCVRAVVTEALSRRIALHTPKTYTLSSRSQRKMQQSIRRLLSSSSTNFVVS